MKRTMWVAIGLAALGVIGGAVLFLARREEAAPQPVLTAPPAVAQAPAAAPSEPAIKHPIEAASSASSPAAPLDVETALAGLFGRKAVLAMFQLDEFPRRFVATVDNLGRSHATAKLWPLNPVDGRFIVGKQGATEAISPDNGMRYTPYVLLLEQADLRQAAAAYASLYPLFQHAYEDMGYPHGYFNDRLVEVIDQLLATPESNEPLRVHLPPVNGPVQPARPWVLYEFDDPALQALSAGQKILLRMGPVNEHRVKAKLAEARRLLASAGQAPGPSPAR